MNQHIGKSRSGNTTEMHAFVDGLGNLVYVELSGDQVNDNTVAIDLRSNIDSKIADILGDKAYGIKEFRTYITSQEAIDTISPKFNTKEPWDFDWWIYKERHLVECFFNKSNIFVEL